ncbi:MAG: sugar transferase [Actinomycetota bacterium]|nr:sugar transferase [Actinomycetota bacterium]
MTDAACLAIAFFAAHALRFGLVMTRDLSLIILGGPIIWIGIFAAWHLYSPQDLAAPDEFRRVLSAVTTSVLIVGLGSYWSRTTFSRGWIALSWIIALVLVLITRDIWRRWIHELKVSGDLAFRTVVVGGNEEADYVARGLQGRGSGFNPIGRIALAREPSTFPTVGSLSELRRLIRDHSVECLFVASTDVDSEGLRMLSLAARFEDVELRLSANLPEMLTSRLSLQPVGSLMALSLKPPQLSSFQSAVKRTFDLLVAIPLVVFLLPLLGVIAVAIKVTSRGTVFFIQPRVTKGGRTFAMYKFRTMHQESQSLLDEAGIDPSAAFFKLVSDPRVTSVGRFLRRLSLDELPQLFNVIKGDMSLVGPRPLPVDQVVANADLLAPRHVVPAGMTGWWQIRGRSALNSEESVKLDLFYIENWSLSLDLYIMIKTFSVVATARGAL